jgi:hypothetical protein
VRIERHPLQIISATTFYSIAQCNSYFSRKKRAISWQGKRCSQVYPTGVLVWGTGAAKGEPESGTQMFDAERYSTVIFITVNKGSGEHISAVSTFIRNKLTL